jgi:hypothetical protein
VNDPVFAIAIEASTDLQRKQVQAAVKQHAELWWHGLADLWLVVGRSASEWRDLIGPIFPTVGSGKVIVLRLGPAWASRGKLSDTETEWLHENVASYVSPKAIDS